MSFEIHLPLFEGPFDLLLFFIERDELDIYDIPIAQVTNDFNLYLRKLEEMNLEVASDFILVAAEINESGLEIDPREELVQHLLEYKKYKEATRKLAENESDRIARYERGNIESELKSLLEGKEDESEWESLDLYKLMKVFHKVMHRFEVESNAPKHVVVQYPYSIEGQSNFIKEKLRLGTQIAFTDLVELMPQKIAVVFNFLAILELIQLQTIEIVIGEGFNNFWLRLKDETNTQIPEEANPQSGFL
jgi:segregation and condensation protein A